MVLIDSNVLLDVFNGDPAWEKWSASQIEDLGEREILAINPIIYAEISLNYQNESELDEALSPKFFRRLTLPYGAAFIAGRAFLAYRKRDGTRRSPLPDFFIGAHAQIDNLTLLTRDAARYRTYFPKVRLIAPLHSD